MRSVERFEINGPFPKLALVEEKRRRRHRRASWSWNNQLTPPVGCVKIGNVNANDVEDKVSGMCVGFDVMKNNTSAAITFAQTDSCRFVQNA
jgi:hypothetical protein